MSEEKKTLTQVIMAAAHEAHQIGFEEGREVGQAEGFVSGMAHGVAVERNRLRGPISDGVRHGSSQCASALRTTDWDHSDED